jgi:hypothetical protein
MINNSGLSRAATILAADFNAIAVGTGATPSASATQLTTELTRGLVTTSTIDGYTIIKEIYFSEAQAVGNLTELGLFCNGATATAGSGQLFASGAAAVNKTSTQSLTISFEIELQEVI